MQCCENSKIEYDVIYLNQQTVNVTTLNMFIVDLELQINVSDLRALILSKHRE